MRFGRLIVISLYSKIGRCYTWKCKCECGNETIVRRTNLGNGHTKSCGCFSNENRIIRNTTHGCRNHPIYPVWRSMRYRCQIKNNRHYKDYGMRGIKVCKRWEYFGNFLIDMGERPSRLHSIDRINNNGDYEPTNCKWSTTFEQANNKSNNRFLVLLGECDTIANWCRRLGLSLQAIRRRISVDWPIERALLVPTPWFEGRSKSLWPCEETQ